MEIATLHQLLTVYDEHVRTFFPKDSPLAVLAIIRLLQDGPLTQKELIQRTGLRQSHVSKLLKKFREDKLQFVEPHSVRNQKEALTARGQSWVAKLEAALSKVHDRTGAERTESVQAAPPPEDPSDNETPAPPKIDLQKVGEGLKRLSEILAEWRRDREKSRRTAP